MHKAVRSAKKFSEFGSNNALAKELINQFPGTDWPQNPRSLGNKIGDLDNGRVTWWANSPDKAKHLAQLLDVPLADLGLHSQAGNHFFSFSEFPELPPIDLKREAHWILADAQLDLNQLIWQLGNEGLDHWLRSTPQDAMRPPHGMDWLYVPDDLEHQLLSRSLAVAGPYEVLFVETLADSGDRLLDLKPLIVSVREGAGDEDLVALARRPQNAGILVLAPFMPPVRTETSSAEYMCWEVITSRGQERDRFMLTAPGPSGSLKRWTWTLFPDWRFRLQKWVEERLNRNGIDTLYSAQGMKDWLDRFDPRAEWFCTTADMMHLCRMGHFTEKELPAPNDPNAGNKLLQSMFGKKSFSQSIRIKQLAEARWNRRDMSWQGDLPLETWLSLAQSSTAKASRAELNAIAQGGTLSERKKAADRVANMLESGNPDALLSSGLMKQGRHGNFDFQHRTLAGLVVRDSLIRQIAAESLESWALACFDPTRRHVVDAALDAISMDNLVSAAERLGQELPDSAVAIGASEALFMAVGRRIAEEKQIPQALMSVARIVLRRLELKDGWGLPNPWSRPMESQDEQLEWIGACWAWSLMPDNSFSISGNWLFPGWSDSLAEAPYWLTTLWPDEKVERLSSAWERFFPIVDQWVKDLEHPIVDAPFMMRIGLLGKAARGAWPADPAWWHGIISLDSRYWVEDALLKRFEQGGKGAAARLWPSFLAFERHCPADKHFSVKFSGVRIWLLKQLKPTEALGPLGEDDLRYLALMPELLPPAFREPLLRMLVQNPPVKSVCDALPFLARFGPSAAPALGNCLDHDILGWAAAECLWSWDAEKAVRLLRQSEELSTEARMNLLNVCPAGFVAAAAEVLLANPALFDLSDRLFWARKHLSKAGSEVEHLVAILGMS